MDQARVRPTVSRTVLAPEVVAAILDGTRSPEETPSIRGLSGATGGAAGCHRPLTAPSCGSFGIAATQGCTARITLAALEAHATIATMTPMSVSVPLPR